MQNSTAVGPNRLLNGLGTDDLARLRPNLERVHTKRGDALHPVGAPIEHVYFPENGMVSMLTIMKSGEQIETAIIGNEGVVGAWVAIDGANANTQSTVQVEGSAWQIPAPKFIEVYKASDPFRSAMNGYQGVILFQAQQSAGCHAVHSIEARLCRWLLLSQDVLGSEQVPLTQEFLSHMIGVQRSSVSLCAHALQKSGLIRYARGNIKILDRKASKNARANVTRSSASALTGLSPLRVLAPETEARAESMMGRDVSSKSVQSYECSLAA